MKKNTVFFLLLALMVGITTACSSSSDDSDPLVDTTEDTSSDGSDDSTDDTSGDSSADLKFYVASITTTFTSIDDILTWEFTYNDENELQFMDEYLDPSDINRFTYLYEGEYIIGFQSSNVPGFINVELKLDYDDMGRIVRTERIVSESDLFLSINRYTFDDFNRPSTVTQYTSAEDEAMDMAATFFEYEYNDDTPKPYETNRYQVFGDGSFGDPTTNRFEQYSTRPNTLNFGEAADRIPNFMLFDAFETYYTYSNFQQRRNAVNEDGTTGVILRDINLSFDDDGNLVQATIDFYGDVTGEIFETKTQTFTYELR